MELISDTPKTVAQQSWRNVAIVCISIFIVSASVILADLLGLPGTKVVNLIIAGGREGAPPSIVFNPHQGIRFPIVPRIWNQLFPPNSDRDSTVPTPAGIKRFLKGDEKVLNGVDSERFDSGH
jgi:hypothetical protein